MSSQDPIADMLTFIRNAQTAKKSKVVMPSSKAKVAIAKVLKSEGYIGNFDEVVDGAKKSLHINIKYHQGKPVISKIKRYSKPSLRKYSPCSDIPVVLGGLGIAIVSTSRGVISSNKARRLNVGGEVICLVE